MTREELEFQIAQYADGTLPAEGRDALEAVLAADASARALLEQYRKLDAVLKAERSRRSMPGVDWERLAARTAAAVASHAGRAADVTEEMEFAIARYADGSIADEDRDAVEAELASNPRARLMLAEYASVDAALKGQSSPPPAVRWDALQARISSEVAKHDDASASAGVPEELEFQIAQLADGTLPEAQRDAVEQALAGSAAARLLFAEYVALGGVVNAAKGEPLPAVRWERLADRISGAVAREAKESGTALEAREGGEPASYPIFGWLRSPSRLALAASVFVAAAIGVSLLRPRGGPGTTPLHNPQRLVVKDVVGPTEELAKGPPVEDIAIGPPSDRGEFANGYTDDAITRPSRSFVASGALPVHNDAPQLAWPQ
jgi:anti-sigma factor RsiW